MTSQRVKESPEEAEASTGRWGKLGLFVLTSLGVVYGDIGTNTLFAVRECFFGKERIEASEPNVLGILSLVAWALILVISLKYLLFVLRADYDGEGGILALMELVKRPCRGSAQKTVLMLGLFGAALLYGDGMITPAISVLSAVEGLNVATSVLKPYIIPITIALLVGLFLLQRAGSTRVGKLFGPIMVVWFFTLAVSGAAEIARRPSVLAAFNPCHGFKFFLHNGLAGFRILGVVVLAVTGGEALYADIGHFGVLPIRLGWYGVALPSLLLNYFGQGAAILLHPGKISNPFYQMVPGWALYPLVVLAACATVIASQAIIAGAFSLAFQSFQLGYLPRQTTHHTSAAQRGQIYIPLVNWVMLLATVGLVLGFQQAENLASAYGMAITTTMVITSLLFFVAMRKVFEWPRWLAGGLTTLFLLVDLPFFVASLWKFLDGGWFPLLVAGLVFMLMATWRRGFATEHRKSRNRILTVREFLADIGGGGKYRRVPDQAVYLTSNPRGTPHSLRHNLRHNRVLHETVVLYTAYFVKAPHVRAADRFKLSKLRADITRVVAYYGYMESADVPNDLAEVNRQNGLNLDLDHVTYFVGGGLLLAVRDIGMAGWRSALYTVMARNEMRITNYFNLPSAQVFEIGMQIEV